MDNLPVDVVRMGADIVIAVNIGTPLLPREELGSDLRHRYADAQYLTEQNVRASIASLKASDVLIVPDLAKVTSSVDFKARARCHRRGAEAYARCCRCCPNYALAPTDYVEQRPSQRGSSPCRALTRSA